jgi:TolB protein
MATDLASAGRVPVTVVNPAPGGGSSNAVTFTVPAAAIAFQSLRALDGSDALNTNSTQNIWTMNPDGSSAAPLSRLTAANTIASNPVWSPDGSKIAYESTGALDGSDAASPNHSRNIWVVDADGSNPKPLTRITAVAGGFNPKWSPDGSKIAYESDRAVDGSDAFNTNRTFNIWVMNADGSGATPLTRNTALSANSLQPAFSPDSSKVVFCSSGALDGSDAVNTNFALNIWLINADGSGAIPLTRLTALGSDSVTPVFSPDGSKIAFSSHRALDGSNAMNTNDNDNIWTINRDGTQAAPVTRLTAFLAGAELPLWSPDGSKISFFSSRALDGSDARTPNGTSNIWTVQADGSSPTPLTKLTASQAYAVLAKWSPDGSKLIFESTGAFDGGNAVSTNVTSNIWAVNADGSGATPLTRLTNAPSGSPDTP